MTGFIDTPKTGIVVRDLRLVYIPVPKAACSSVKAVLREVLGMPACRPYWKIHETQWPELAGPGEVHAYAALGFHVFTVIRNPWDRLYSCYKSKIHPDRISDLWRGGGQKDLFRLDMTFPEFVDAVVKIPDLNSANEHIRPQSSILHHYWSNISRLLYFETLKAEWDSWSRLFAGKMPPLPHINATEGREPYRSVYDSFTRQQVATLYGVDCRTFGYEF